MEINYLQALRDYPSPCPDREEYKYKLAIEPLSLSEISDLEQSYNNGVPFPKVLRELLYLAGKNCYVCDYGLYDTQQEM